MSDFETVLLRAPYKVELRYRNGLNRVVVDEAFEILIETVSAQDARRAAMIKKRVRGREDHRIDFVNIGGRLFRPYIDQEKRDFWTAERCRRDPPLFGLDDAWGAYGGRTTLLGSPFRPIEIDTTDQERRRARKAAPEAREQAERRLRSVAGRGLRFVDGVLFQETRSPAWSTGAIDWSDVRGWSQDVSACIPDLTIAPGLTLIDPRHSPERIHEVLAEMGHAGQWESTIEIDDPSLLPATVEADALASFCLWLYDLMSETDVRYFDRRFLGEVVNLIGVSEEAIRDGDSLDPCYAAVERLAGWRDYVNQGGPFDDIEHHMVTPAKAAQDFLDLKRALPPAAARPSDDEVDGIADAFRP